VWVLYNILKLIFCLEQKTRILNYFDSIFKETFEEVFSSFLPFEESSKEKAFLS